MLKEGMTILDAAQRWVGQFNAIPTGMVEKLMRQSRDEWREITLPSRPGVCQQVSAAGL